MPQLDRSTSRSRARSPSKDKAPRFSPTALIIPIAIASRLAPMLAATTNFTVMQNVACRIWYILHSPGDIPTIGPIPDELCRIPDVDRYYTVLSSILATLDGIGTVVSCGAYGYLSSRLGRKPILVTALLLSVAAQLAIMTSQHVVDWLQILLFAVGVLCSISAQPPAMIYVINMYIVDVSGAEERTAALSKIAGWTALGSAVSFSLGGTLTAKTKDTTAVYLLAATILLLACLYVIYLVPESFPADKREELRREREAQNPTAGERTLRQKINSYFSVVLEPLKQLKPSYNPITGKRNMRLVYCAIHIFIVAVADGYAVLSMILYFTTQHHYTPAQTGYVLTTINGCSTIMLTAFVPLIVRTLRPLYARRQPIALPDDEELPATSSETTFSAQEDVVSEVSDHLDVHVTIGSWVVESLAFIAVGLATTLASQLAAVASIGLGAGRTPVFRSLVAASVDPLKQGEALASIEMIASTGLIFSPVIMGSIFTATVATAPRTIFYVHALISVLGASVLFLVKDSDRFQKQEHEAEQPIALDTQNEDAVDVLQG
ncbi:hypothetical protein D9613_009307 [Agrocybe pediades]|uniref:Uncharacterized protein n=1 Tax=Agrocybe pediades TaxID=84607 RepID=A0A8H4R2B9_9AGAR|nr:hypothetical protein D9613_009307 [Agrocybe pediades]